MCLTIPFVPSIEFGFWLKETRKIIESPDETIKGIAACKREAFEFKREVATSVANIIQKVGS